MAANQQIKKRRQINRYKMECQREQEEGHARGWRWTGGDLYRCLS